MCKTCRKFWVADSCHTCGRSNEGSSSATRERLRRLRKLAFSSALITGAGVVGLTAQADAAPGGHDGNDDSPSYDGGNRIDSNDERAGDDSQPSPTVESSPAVFEPVSSDPTTDSLAQTTFESQPENEATPDINGDGMVSMDEAIATSQPTSTPTQTEQPTPTPEIEGGLDIDASDIDLFDIDLPDADELALGVDLSRADEPTPEREHVVDTLDQDLIDFGGPGPTIVQNNPTPASPDANATFLSLTSQIDTLLRDQSANPNAGPTAQQGPSIINVDTQDVDTQDVDAQDQGEPTAEAPLPNGASEILAAGDQGSEPSDQVLSAPSQSEADANAAEVEPTVTTPDPVLDKYGKAISERALSAAEIQNIRPDQIHVYQAGKPGWDEAMQAVDLLRDLGRLGEAEALETDLKEGRVSAYLGRVTDPSFALKDNLIVNINSESPEQVAKIVHEALHIRQYVSPEPNPEIKAHALETVARLSIDIEKDKAARLTQHRAATIQSFYPQLSNYSVDEVASWLASEMVKVLPEETPKEWEQAKQDLEALIPDLSLDENAKQALMEMGGTGLDPVVAPDGEMRSGDVALSNGPNGTFTVSEYVHERNARVENTIHKNTRRQVGKTVYNYNDNSVDTWDYNLGTKTTIYQDGTSVATEFRRNGTAQRVTIEPDGTENIEVFVYTDDDLR